MNKYRFDGRFECELLNDFLAMEEANTHHDEYSVSVEKWINNSWCSHTTPISHPYAKNYGWVLPNGEISPSCED